MHLSEYVCVEGDHVAKGQTCDRHEGVCVRVVDVYACDIVGIAHICDQRTCTTDTGKCIISGLPCIADVQPRVAPPSTTKRTRRRNSVHTNMQTARILIYDLLFSNRRIASEVARINSVLDVARRKAYRLVKAEGAPIRYQELVDVYADARKKLRSTQYLTVCGSDDSKLEVCAYYARIMTRIWDLLLPRFPARCTFEATMAAILYGMRRGVASDGVYAVPLDKFLAKALPDAHSIKEVDVTRRSLTQAKNALFTAIQSFIRSKEHCVEQLASAFSQEEAPRVLRTFNDVQLERR